MKFTLKETAASEAIPEILLEKERAGMARIELRKGIVFLLRIPFRSFLLLESGILIRKQQHAAAEVAIDTCWMWRYCGTPLCIVGSAKEEREGKWRQRSK